MVKSVQEGSDSVRVGLVVSGWSECWRSVRDGSEGFGFVSLVLTVFVSSPR